MQVATSVIVHVKLCRQALGQLAKQRARDALTVQVGGVTLKRRVLLPHAASSNVIGAYGVTG